MRTDPRPDEVRRIVERVFSGYRKTGGSRGVARVRGVPARESRVGGRRGENRFAGRFPRIYQPPQEYCGPDCAEIEETILIDQGRYVARSYGVEGYLAMWLVAVGIVQFYDARGRMLGAINLFESLRPQRMAA